MQESKVVLYNKIIVVVDNNSNTYSKTIQTVKHDHHKKNNALNKTHIRTILNTKKIDSSTRI